MGEEPVTVIEIDEHRVPMPGEPITDAVELIADLVQQRCSFSYDGATNNLTYKSPAPVQMLHGSAGFNFGEFKNDLVKSIAENLGVTVEELMAPIPEPDAETKAHYTDLQKEMGK